MASPREDVSDYKEEDEEDEDEDMEESSGGEDDESFQKAKQAITCRSVTLNTLMEDGIIEPGQGVLSIDYLGQRFEADLLESGKIKWQGSQEEFGTPSAWALHCKRLVNPIKRSGCGWASVKYKNRKLDIWKKSWARKHRIANPIKSPHQSSIGTTTSTTTAPSATTTPSTTTAATTVTTASTSATTDSSTVSSDIAAEMQPSSLASSSTSSTATTSAASLSVSPHKLDGDVEMSTPGHQDKEKEVVEKELKSDRQEKKTGQSSLSPSSFLSSPGKEAVKSQSRVAPKTSRSTMHDETPLNLSTALPVMGRLENSGGHHSPRKGNVGYIETWLPRERKSVSYSSLGTRGVEVDPHTLVKCEHFDNHSKIQPFTVSVTSNTLLLMDFHCHLTKSEVVGYLGGRWDSHKQHLSIEQVFPARCRLGDKDKAPLVEEEIRRNMRQKNLMVVGWYHSHPYCQPDPSIRDVDCQMSYQLKMRGSGSMYLPCLGFILCTCATIGTAPFEKFPPKPDSKIQAFWVMPNLEHPSSFNIPMHVSYSIVRDSSLTEDLLSDMKLLTEFYSGAVDKVQLKEYWGEAITYMDKIKASLRSKLPEDQLNSSTFLDYVQQLLRDMR